MKKQEDIFIASSNGTTSETAGTLIPPKPNISLASGTITQSVELTGYAEVEKINIPFIGEISGKLKVGFQIKHNKEERF